MRLLGPAPGNRLDPPEHRRSLAAVLFRVDPPDSEGEDRLAQGLGVVCLGDAPRRGEPVRADQRDECAAAAQLGVEPLFPELTAGDAALGVVVEENRGVPLGVEPAAQRIGGGVVFSCCG